MLSLQHPQRTDVHKWVIYKKYGLTWQYDILTAESDQVKLDGFILKQRKTQNESTRPEDVYNVLQNIAVSAVDRLGNESQRININVPEIPFEYAPLSDQDILAKRKPSSKKISRPKIKLGIEVLIEDNIGRLDGLRVL